MISSYHFGAAQRCALPAWGGRVDSLSKREKLKARKGPKKRAESHLSAARPVGTLLTLRLACLIKPTLNTAEFSVRLYSHLGAMQYMKGLQNLLTESS